MSDIIDEARALLAAATPGPWHIPQPSMGFSVIESPTGAVFGLSARETVDNAEHDAAFIAASPRLVAGLLAHADDLTADLLTLAPRHTKRVERANAERRDEAWAALAEMVRLKKLRDSFNGRGSDDYAHGQNGAWHLCDECAAAPKFDRYRVRKRLQQAGTEGGA